MSKLLAYINGEFKLALNPLNAIGHEEVVIGGEVKSEGMTINASVNNSAGGTKCECFLPERFRSTSDTELGCNSNTFDMSGMPQYFKEQEALRTALACYQAKLSSDEDPLNDIHNQMLEFENKLGLGPDTWYWKIVELWDKCRQYTHRADDMT